ncbi:glycosyltransferase family 4 protein [Modestobacter sp. I12A-02662]|uniref:glycosyltransferase family 4 protein n=1 Tax=Modestobacter sp. I12A-02662 TaxID=1730496 RepID=UPI0034DF6D29
MPPPSTGAAVLVPPSAPAGAQDGRPVPGGSHRRRLSVCLYTPSVDPSGMGSHMVDLAAEYQPDVVVTVMAWRTPAGERLLAEASAVGATPVPLPHPRDPAFGRTVEERLREHPVDVFHLHVGTGREDFDGARAARSAGVGAVVETVHLPWAMGSPKHRVPFFASIEPVDRLIAVSELQRRTYERIGVPRELLRTVPNGIRSRGPGPGRAAARSSLGLDDTRPVVLTIGRLMGQKGHRYLVEALPELVRRFPDVAVVIIGQGTLRERLREQAAELGVADHLHLPGYRADARMLLDAADVFALPSRQEAMPLAALEAMDASLPVVATRVYGSAEVVVHRETGLLVPPQDAGALAQAIGELLADPGLRRRYAAAGREHYLRHHTSARMAAQTLAVYDEALAGVSVDRG